MTTHQYTVREIVFGNYKPAPTVKIEAGSPLRALKKRVRRLSDRSCPRAFFVAWVDQSLYPAPQSQGWVWRGGYAVSSSPVIHLCGLTETRLSEIERKKGRANHVQERQPQEEEGPGTQNGYVETSSGSAPAPDADHADPEGSGQDEINKAIALRFVEH